VINFDAPYLATNPREFWRRWHISLSNWLQDYLYISLGGNRQRRSLNILCTMTLGGLWHGAAWTYVIWGAYHGLLLVGQNMSDGVLARLPKPRFALARVLSYCLRLCLFQILWLFGVVMFRSQSLEQLIAMIGSWFQGAWMLTRADLVQLDLLAFYAAIPMLMQIVQYRTGTPIWMLGAPPLIRLVFYLVCFYLLLICGVSGREDFIYFQF
jgi:alginate O-acetyltransferase complex protein AlgI